MTLAYQCFLRYYGKSTNNKRKISGKLDFIKMKSFCVSKDNIKKVKKSPWNSPGQNTRVVSLSLLQGIFPTQGSNPGLPHCRWVFYRLSHKGSPRILEWITYSLLQRIFPTQKLNQGLLHCKWILYQLSYQGSSG